MYSEASLKREVKMRDNEKREKMNRKKEGNGKRLLFTVLILALLVFTAWMALGGVSAGNSTTVIRKLPDYYVEPNEMFVVNLTQYGFFMGVGRVLEELPEGFEYVDGSYTGGAPERVTYDPINRTLDMPFAGEDSIAYSVNASPYEQIAEFSGTWIALNLSGGEEEGPVEGDTEVIVEDETPPASITNLQSTTGSTWITWTWTNPGDADFSHVMVYLNGTWQTNTTRELYNAKGLKPDTEYEIGTRTVDEFGNINATWVNDTARTGHIFDTGSTGTYPSISGTHNGTIKPNVTIEVSTLYTYPCPGTGGHTEYARIWNDSGLLDVSATWKGYVGDWHKIVFNPSFTLVANETYNYTIRTGSYPQIHHNKTLTVANGEIRCIKFIDVNGRVYYDWIPAFKLYF